MTVLTPLQLNIDFSKLESIICFSSINSQRGDQEKGRVHWPRRAKLRFLLLVCLCHWLTYKIDRIKTSNLEKEVSMSIWKTSFDFICINNTHELGPYWAPLAYPLGVKRWQFSRALSRIFSEMGPKLTAPKTNSISSYFLHYLQTD